jgi:hypothetical protein
VVMFELNGFARDTDRFGRVLDKIQHLGCISA